MERLYYDSDTGLLCNRYPTDIAKTEDSKWIEVSDEIAAQTYSCPSGKHWIVKDNNLELMDYETEESKSLRLKNNINEKKSYLQDTDYVVLKINEASFFKKKTLKKKYKDILEKRQQCRDEINELKKEASL